jgi:hypothetical protein
MRRSRPIRRPQFLNNGHEAKGVRGYRWLRPFNKVRQGATICKKRRFVNRPHLVAREESGGAHSLCSVEDLHTHSDPSARWISVEDLHTLRSLSAVDFSRASDTFRCYRCSTCRCSRQGGRQIA